MGCASQRGSSIAVKGGRALVENRTIRVQGASEALLLVSAATDYQGFAGRRARDPLAESEADLAKASAKSYDSLLAAHVKDYQRYYGRASLTLGGGTTDQPTPRRLRNADSDAALAALYFNYGRYLLISSSRARRSARKPSGDLGRYHSNTLEWRLAPRRECADELLAG